MQRGAQQQETSVKAHPMASLLSAAALVAPMCAAGASISATYHPLTGDQWFADFVVTGDGAPSVIKDLTVYFPDSSFAGLVLNSSPANWDSLIVQPDVALHSAGFLDSLALGSGIGNGASLGGFQVKFDYLGQGVPPALHFDINDAEFQPLFSGLTTVAAVPEPEAAWLMALGLGAIAGARIRKHRKIQVGGAA
jgi:hypothetical protein